MAMQEPIPKGSHQPVMVDQEEGQFQQAIADSATEAGIPTRREDILPDPLHVIENAGELAYDANRIIRGSAEGSSHVDTTRPHRALDIIRGRQKIGGKIVSILGKLGFKKAA